MEIINGELTDREKRLLHLMYHEGETRKARYTHNTERHHSIKVKRLSPREFDLEVDGKTDNVTTRPDRYGVVVGGVTEWKETPAGTKSSHGFTAWLPLAVIYDHGDWGNWVSDWSIIRDDTREQHWKMFAHTLRTKVSV